MSISRIVFSLGSNLGDREYFISKAINKLYIDLNLSNIKKSKILENQALLLPNSPEDWDKPFLNIAVSADINYKIFTPNKILLIIKKIERDLGRLDNTKWSPRNIDIDIMAIDNKFININEINLFIPHKDLLKRSFFINTFKDIELDLFLNIKHLLSIDNTNTTL